MSNTEHCRLVTLQEVAAKDPAFAPMVNALRQAYPKIRAGAAVKLLVEAVGQAHPAPEQIWVLVASHRGRVLLGKVNTHTERSRYHRVKYGQEIQFEEKHIIDVLTQGGARIA